MEIFEKKKKLRKEMLIQRGQLSKLKKAKYDEWVCESLWAKIEKENLQNIHCYLPMGMEINIFPLIEKLLEKGITVVTPKTLPKRKLKNLILRSLSKLEKGVFGTVHPAGDEVFEGEYDLIIVPGLAFDKNNYRLGYGGGYYDNFMINYPNAQKIGVFYPFQEVEKIPLESHDIRLDEIKLGKFFD